MCCTHGPSGTMLLKKQVLPGMCPYSLTANSRSYCASQSQPPHSHCLPCVPTKSQRFPSAPGTTDFKTLLWLWSPPFPPRHSWGGRWSLGAWHTVGTQGMLIVKNQTNKKVEVKNLMYHRLWCKLGRNTLGAVEVGCEL